MQINVKEFSEKLGTEPKKFRKFLRSGKLTQASKVDGVWNLNDTELADPIEYIKNLMVTRVRVEGSGRKKGEKVEKIFVLPEYITDKQPHWYGVKVDGGREREVKDALLFFKEKFNIGDILEVFVPTQEVVKNGSKNTRCILTKIVFLKTANIMEVINPVKESNSKVKGFWMSMPDDNGNKVPALIEEETILSLKELDGRTVTDEEINGYEIGREVEVTEGPFKHTKGYIQGVNGDTINVEIVILGRPLPMHISSKQLRLID